MVLFYYAYFKVDWSYYWGAWYWYNLGYLDCGLFILAAYHGVSFLARLKFVQWIGRNAYGIFLWNYLALELWKTGLGKIPPTLMMVGYILTAGVLGVLSTRMIERPFLSLREKLAPTA